MEPNQRGGYFKTIIKTFSIHKLKLEANTDKISDKSLKSIRGIGYEVPSYRIMLEDLAKYYGENKKIYNYKL